jgi:hypothetical protein
MKKISLNKYVEERSILKLNYTKNLGPLYVFETIICLSELFGRKLMICQRACLWQKLSLLRADHFDRESLLCAGLLLADAVDRP